MSYLKNNKTVTSCWEWKYKDIKYYMFLTKHSPEMKQVQTYFSNVDLYINHSRPNKNILGSLFSQAGDRAQCRNRLN